jgi:long-subunit fatty acid transport protein
MKFQVFLLMVALVFVLGQVILGQDPQQYVINGNGARAAGMGNAFTGLADDATAISWNAAGLTQLYSPEASIVGRFGFGSLDPDYQDVDVSVTTGSTFQLNFASLAVPFSAGNINIVGGVAYRRIFDFTNDFEIKVSDFGFEGSTKTENTGGIDAISPALGIQLNEMISVGAAANILVGSTDYLSEINTPLIDFSDEYSEEYSGVAFDIGVLVKPSPTVQIGANFNLPYSITINEMVEGFDDFEYMLNIPFSFSIGVALRASDNLTVAADFKSRPWSNAEFEYDGETEDLEAENANSIHVGLEYLAEAGNSVLPLRVGFYTLPTPGTDMIDDQITFNAVTAGLGIIMGNIILDGSFEYIFGSYVGDEVDDTNVDYNVGDFRVTVGGVVHFGN